MTRTTRVIALAACIALSVSASAQTFPERPVQIITPYAAGVGLDIITRTLAQKLSTQWGKQVLVDNKPGAGSTLGTALAAKAPKDGHTLLVASTPLGVAPAVYATLPYDARRDFAPLALVATTPEVLVVTPSLGVASVAALVAKAKAGKQNFGSAGSGTLGHLAADSVNRRLNLGATHIPYKGSNPAAMDLIGGQIDWMMDTPEPVLRAIEAGIAEAMRDPALRAAITAQGWEIVGSGAREFAAFLDQELPKLTAAARAAGVKAD